VSKLFSRGSLRQDAGELFRLAHTFRILSGDKLFVFGVGTVTLLAILAAAAPWVTPYPAQGMGAAAIPPPTCPGVATEIVGVCPPSPSHPLGTETLGRDLLSRVIFGVRTSLLIGVLVVAIAIAIGMTVGMTAAYFGGWVDEILMRITDVFLSFPHLLLALLIVATIGPSFWGVLIALGATWWTSFARLSRSRALSVKVQNYVLAAKAAGVGGGGVLLRHILPNSIAPLTVQVALDLGVVVLAEAGLSFLGLGVRPPTADLGVLIFDSRNFLTTAWWYALFPGIFLILIALSFNLIGDRINTYLDPRLKKR
jgi:peptide/nickel transport system permease protein